MTEIEILTNQTESVYKLTNKLIKAVPFKEWDSTPEILSTNISWQVGHLILSHYFHSVMVIVGHQIDVMQKIPIKEYDGLYTNALPAQSIGKVNPKDLIEQLDFVQQKSISIIKELTLEELECELVPTSIPHPIAKTKFEAIDWNIMHTMYHCGQIGILNRVIVERYNFGLKRGI